VVSRGGKFLIDLFHYLVLIINTQVQNLRDEQEKVKAEAKLMQQYALLYINDVVETMGNALLGRVYDLESKHHKEFSLC